MLKPEGEKRKITKTRAIIHNNQVGFFIARGREEYDHHRIFGLVLLI